MAEYTQGVCADGAAILKDGVMLTVEEIIELLRQGDALMGQGEAVPVFWVRVHPDGEPSRDILHNDTIEDVRKKSGAWKPMFLHPAPSVPAQGSEAVGYVFRRSICSDHDPADCEEYDEFVSRADVDLEELAEYRKHGMVMEVYTKAPAVDDGVLRDAERFSVCAIANRICGEIPDDFHIEMVLENGSGWVSLFHKGKPVDIDMADWNIAEQFDVAMQCVKEIVQEQQDANRTL